MKICTTRTLGDALDEVAAKYPDNLAVVFKGRRITYRELQRQANLLAKGLIKLGIQRGDNVALWMGNCTDWIVTEYAVAKLGACLVTVNTRNRTFETEYILKQSESKCLILRDKFLNIGFMEMVHEIVPELATSKPGNLSSAGLPNLRSVVCLAPEDYPGTLSFERMFEYGSDVPDAELARMQAAVQPDDAVLIVYTSGTTGTPKGAVLTHHGCLPHYVVVAERTEMTLGDRWVLAQPLFHGGGCVLSVMACLLTASTMYLMETWNATEALTLIQGERCTMFNGVPTMFIDILEHPDFAKYDLRTLRTGHFGGQSIPVELMRNVIDKVEPRIMTSYGLTEGGLCQLSTVPGDSAELVATTVGIPYPDQEVAIFDPATGERLGYGVQGEIRVRAESVMKGYYKNPEETAKAIDRDGWLHTGDLGVQNANGYFRITGRLKDMYIFGGINAYPAEIENYLYTHPKVKNVYVAGVPDHRMGEVAMAFIELKEGEKSSADEIIGFCKGKLANYKVPRYVKFMTEFPLTPIGKVAKYKLQELAIVELGLKKEAVF